MSAEISFLSATNLSEAIIVKFSDGKVLGIDCGSYADRDEVLACYTALNVTHLDYLVISHYHQDHVGGMSILTTNSIIDNNTLVFLPTDINTSLSDVTPDWSDVITQYNTSKYLLAQAGCFLYYPSSGQTYTIADNCILEFWNTNHAYYYDNSTNYNDFSLCCNLKLGDVRVSFTGDIGDIAQAQCAGNLYKSNICKAQHHGWDGAEANLIPCIHK